MIRFDRFFRNPFDDKEISFDELSAYTTDTLGRMIANNPGAFLNLRINATTVAFTALETCADTDQTRLGLRKARIMLKDQFRAGLAKQLEYIEAAIVNHYKANAAGPLLEVFPQGRKVFSDCRDDHLNNHLNPMVTALTTLSAPNGPMPNNALGDAGGLQSTWLALYAASETSSSNKAATENEKRTCRKALQKELFLNLLFLAAAFPNEPEKAALYMRQSLLENPTAGEDEPENPAPVNPTPGA